MSHDEYQLQSCNCVIRLYFERYEPRLTSTEFIDPTDTNGGMAFWILSHILGIQIQVSDKNRPYYGYGKAIVDYCSDLLNGDFSVRKEYDKFKDRILDRMFEVRGLPQDHPTRIRFENHDLQWLLDLEDGQQ